MTNDDMMTRGGGGGEKEEKRALALVFKDHFQPSIMTPPFFLGVGGGPINKKPGMFGFMYQKKE